jgi:hypothetical protein
MKLLSAAVLAPVFKGMDKLLIAIEMQRGTKTLKSLIAPAKLKLFRKPYNFKFDS